jgi:hypothetical protein
MEKIKSVLTARWQNYHQTTERLNPDYRALCANPGPGASPAAHFAATGALLQQLVGEAQASGQILQALGASWSFSRILSGSGILLDTSESSAVFRLADDPELAHLDPGLVLVSGGTRIGHLNRWLTSKGLSLFTSGAHDGQSVAGACATATHGSAVGLGGFADHVRGVHMITGPDRSAWIERGPEAILPANVAGRFATEQWLDGDLLEAATVHLGGLGIVNAMMLETVPDFGVAVVRRKLPFREEHVALLSAGRYRDFAAAIWPDAPAEYSGAEPYFVEVTLNPFAESSPIRPHPRPAVITLLFRTDPPVGVEGESRSVDDVLNLLAERSDAAVEVLPPPWMVGEAVAAAARSEPVSGQQPRVVRWGTAMGKHKRLPIDLYNAAFAVPRVALEAALEALSAALFALGPAKAGPLVFTLRFVTGAKGHLAFQRFFETVVINVDGWRTGAAAQSAERMALALEAASIDFSQHWGKQGLITRNRLHREYGDPADPSARLGRWSDARRRLLSPGCAAVFANDLLRDLNLV